MGKTTRLTTEKFIEKATLIYGDKYDYSKVEYINNRTKVCIICPEHGEFFIKPLHFFNGHACPICANKNRIEKKTYKKDEFVKKASFKHDNKYDYSKVEYRGCFEKVCIICPEHGEFWQAPGAHIHGQGCPECGGVKRLNKELFVEKANKIHSNKYDYSKVEYVNNKTKICIICPEHGEFWQRPDMHLRGDGCPICNRSILEKEIMNFLAENGINFIYQAKKTNCNKLHFLGRLSLDFFIPDYNVGIECQGIQHFKCDESKKSFYSENAINETIERDNRKREFCEKNGIRLLYYSNLGIKYPYYVFEEKNNLLKEILKK